LITRSGVTSVGASFGLPAAIGPSQAHRSVATQGAAIARAWAELLPFQISRSLLQWAAKFEPQLILSPLGSLRWTRLVHQLSTRLSVPVVPFFFDDWPSSYYRFSSLVRRPRQALLNCVDSVVQHSKVILCISDAMAEEYAERYSVPTAAFMRCVSTNDPKPIPENSGEGGIRLLYVGGLHLDRGRVLQLIGEALYQLRKDGIKTSLTIYAPEDDVRAWKRQLDKQDVVQVAGTLQAEDVTRALQQADVLVHVESFDGELSRFTRLSLSTKLPEYMASGRPLLGVGPGSLSSIRYIQRSGAGIVVDSESSDGIAAAVRSLATQPTLRESLAQAGLRTVRLRHDDRCERQRLRSLLKCVGEGMAVDSSVGQLQATGPAPATELEMT
jgi:glycosyltransferase involved in cell wall biosynthesis